jgi:hypothetical protein
MHGEIQIAFDLTRGIQEIQIRDRHLANRDFLTPHSTPTSTFKRQHHCRFDLTTHGEKETEQRKESSRCSNPFPNKLPPSSSPYYPITSSTALPCHK